MESALKNIEFQISLTTERDGFIPQNLVIEVLLPALEKVLQRYNKQTIIVIDTIELDLGTFLYEAHREDMKSALIEKMEQFLTHFFFSSAGSSQSHKKGSKDRISVIEYFLQNGVMPWYSSSRNLTNDIIDLLRADPTQVEDLIQTTLKKSRFIERWSRYFTFSDYRYIINTISTIDSSFILRLLQLLPLAVAQLLPYQRERQKICQTLLLLYTVLYLLQISSPIGSHQDFFSYLLTKIAAESQQTLSIVITEIGQYLLHTHKLSEAEKDFLTELLDKKQLQQALQQNKPLLAIENGSINWLRLIKENPKGIREMLKNESSIKKYNKLWQQHLSTEEYYALITLLSPQNHQWVLTLYAELHRNFADSSSSRGSLNWQQKRSKEQILLLVAEYQNRPFNRKAFLGALLKRIVHQNSKKKRQFYEVLQASEPTFEWSSFEKEVDIQQKKQAKTLFLLFCKKMLHGQKGAAVTLLCQIGKRYPTEVAKLFTSSSLNSLRKHNITFEIPPKLLQTLSGSRAISREIVEQAILIKCEKGINDPQKSSGIDLRKQLLFYLLYGFSNPLYRSVTTESDVLTLYQKIGKEYPKERGILYTQLSTIPALEERLFTYHTLSFLEKLLALVIKDENSPMVTKKQLSYWLPKGAERKRATPSLLTALFRKEKLDSLPSSTQLKSIIAQKQGSKTAIYTSFWKELSEKEFQKMVQKVLPSEEGWLFRLYKTLQGESRTSEVATQIRESVIIEASAFSKSIFHRKVYLVSLVRKLLKDQIFTYEQIEKRVLPILEEYLPQKEWQELCIMIVSKNKKLPHITDEIDHKRGESSVTDSGKREKSLHEKRKEVEKSELSKGELFLIGNSGIVLLSPYLPRLFEQLNYLHENSFINREKQERALYLLQYLAYGESSYREEDLLLNKLLCGLSFDHILSLPPLFTEEEKELTLGLLQAIIKHWSIIGNTSVEGVRETFLQRDGGIYLEEDMWQLKVYPEPYDMLLQQLPWSFSMIRYSWMEELISVEWNSIV